MHASQSQMVKIAPKTKTFFLVSVCYLPKLNENVGKVDKKRDDKVK